MKIYKPDYIDCSYETYNHMGNLICKNLWEIGPSSYRAIVSWDNKINRGATRIFLLSQLVKQGFISEELETFGKFVYIISLEQAWKFHIGNYNDEK